MRDVPVRSLEMGGWGFSREPGDEEQSHLTWLSDGHPYGIGGVGDEKRELSRTMVSVLTRLPRREGIICISK